MGSVIGGARGEIGGEIPQEIRANGAGAVLQHHCLILQSFTIIDLPGEAHLVDDLFRLDDEVVGKLLNKSASATQALQ